MGEMRRVISAVTRSGTTMIRAECTGGFQRPDMFPDFQSTVGSLADRPEPAVQVAFEGIRSTWLSTGISLCARVRTVLSSAAQ